MEESGLNIKFSNKKLDFENTDDKERKVSVCDGGEKKRNKRIPRMSIAILPTIGPKSDAGSIPFSPTRRQSVWSMRRPSMSFSGLQQKKIFFENTYRLEPDPEEKFNPIVARNILQQCMEQRLRTAKYDSTQSPKLALSLSEEIRSQLKMEQLDRYKFVVHVTIGQRAGQGILTSSRCLWQPDVDQLASLSLHNEHIVAVAIVFGIYFN